MRLVLLLLVASASLSRVASAPLNNDEENDCEDDEPCGTLGVNEEDSSTSQGGSARQEVSGGPEMAGTNHDGSSSSGVTALHDTGHSAGSRVSSLTTARVNANAQQNIDSSSSQSKNNHFPSGGHAQITEQQSNRAENVANAKLSGQSSGPIIALVFDDHFGSKRPVQSSIGRSVEIPTHLFETRGTGTGTLSSQTSEGSRSAGILQAASSTSVNGGPTSTVGFSGIIPGISGPAIIKDTPAFAVVNGRPNIEGGIRVRGSASNSDASSSTGVHNRGSTSTVRLSSQTTLASESVGTTGTKSLAGINIGPTNTLRFSSSSPENSGTGSIIDKSHSVTMKGGKTTEVGISGPSTDGNESGSISNVQFFAGVNRDSTNTVQFNSQSSGAIGSASTSGATSFASVNRGPSVTDKTFAAVNKGQITQVGFGDVLTEGSMSTSISDVSSAASLNRGSASTLGSNGAIATQGNRHASISEASSFASVNGASNSASGFMSSIADATVNRGSTNTVQFNSQSPGASGSASTSGATSFASVNRGPSVTDKTFAAVNKGQITQVGFGDVLTEGSMSASISDVSSVASINRGSTSTLGSNGATSAQGSRRASISEASSLASINGGSNSASGFTGSTADASGIPSIIDQTSFAITNRRPTSTVGFNAPTARILEPTTKVTDGRIHEATTGFQSDTGELNLAAGKRGETIDDSIMSGQFNVASNTAILTSRVSEAVGNQHSNTDIKSSVLTDVSGTLHTLQNKQGMIPRDFTQAMADLNAEKSQTMGTGTNSQATIHVDGHAAIAQGNLVATMSAARGPGLVASESSVNDAFGAGNGNEISGDTVSHHTTLGGVGGNSNKLIQNIEGSAGIQSHTSGHQEKPVVDHVLGDLSSQVASHSSSNSALEKGNAKHIFETQRNAHNNKHGINNAVLNKGTSSTQGNLQSQQSENIGSFNQNTARIGKPSSPSSTTKISEITNIHKTQDAITTVRKTHGGNLLKQETSNHKTTISDSTLGSIQTGTLGQGAGSTTGENQQSTKSLAENTRQINIQGGANVAHSDQTLPNHQSQLDSTTRHTALNTDASMIARKSIETVNTGASMSLHNSHGNTVSQMTTSQQSDSGLHHILHSHILTANNAGTFHSANNHANININSDSMSNNRFTGKIGDVESTIHDKSMHGGTEGVSNSRLNSQVVQGHQSAVSEAAATDVPRCRFSNNGASNNNAQHSTGIPGGNVSHLPPLTGDTTNVGVPASRGNPWLPEGSGRHYPADPKTILGNHVPVFSMISSAASGC